MPKYDYECTQCAHRFESQHAMDAPAPDCPLCQAKVKKLFLRAPAAHGHMANGRELAMQSLDTPKKHACGGGCQCGHKHP